MLSNIKNKTHVNIVQVFLWTIIGILLTFGIITGILAVTNNMSWDLPNWITLVVEVGVGIIVAGSILVYDRNKQGKFEKEQEKISELIVEIKKMEERQERLLDEEKKFRVDKIIFAEKFCAFYLDGIKKQLEDLKSASKSTRQFKNYSTTIYEIMMHYTEKLNDRKNHFMTELTPAIIENIELIVEDVRDMNLELIREKPSSYDDILELIEGIYEEFHKEEFTSKGAI